MDAFSTLLPEWLTTAHLTRRVLNAAFVRRARRRVAEIDHEDLARAQARTLRGLVHQARNTRFGREHDFHRMRTHADFVRLVPLRTPAQLWQEYWRPAFPELAGVTWPGSIAALALSAPHPDGVSGYIPVSPALCTAHRTAISTALAFAAAVRPRINLFAGRSVFLGGDSPLNLFSSQARPSSLAAGSLQELPVDLRPYALSLSHLDVRFGYTLEDCLRTLAQRSLTQPIACLAGTAERLLRLFAHLRHLSKHESLAHIWPDLEVILYARRPVDPERGPLLGALGLEPASLPWPVLEVWLEAEGPVAVEDPRFGLLRLLPDLGTYYEFVPAAEIGKERPTRCRIEQVEKDVPYAVALTSPAGLWACLLDRLICFESRTPPLFRLLDVPVALPAPVAAPAFRLSQPGPAHAFPVQPPHPRSGGNRVGRPGKLARSASSARADRG